MKIGLYLHPNIKNLAKVLPLLVDYLLHKNQVIILPDSTPRELFKKHAKINYLPKSKIGKEIDAMFSVGGDGTFLAASRIIAGTNKPVFGIHRGGLGFLADVSEDNYRARIDAFIDGDFTIEERIVLSAKVYSPKKVANYFSYNDFVIDKAPTTSMIKIRTYVDDDFLNTYRADGLIISTPTGSTAYGLSAGGPIISPHLDVFTICPICPHSLSARSVLISANQTIKIDCEKNLEASLVIDGQNRIALKSANKIEFNKADFRLNIVRFEGDSFFKTLRKKLHWGIDSRG